MPRVLKTRAGQDFYIDDENNFWRAISYVEGARSFDTISSTDHAREVGHALGTFQHLISDLPVGDPGRHPGRLSHHAALPGAV